jgi:outer membrane lipoprotein-sorting protein
MKRAPYLILAFLAAFLIVFPCRSQEPPEEKIDLDAILSSASQTESFSCDFRQEKHLSMLKKPVTTSGRLYYAAPDQLRWDQEKPALAGFMVKDKKLKRWEGQEGRAETVDLAKDIGLNIFVTQVFAWHNGNEEWLRKQYQVEVMKGSPPTVRLVPLDKVESRFVSHLDITFSEDLKHVQKVEVKTRKKDAITTSFSKCMINPSLPDDLFR